MSVQSVMPVVTVTQPVMDMKKNFEAKRSEAKEKQRTNSVNISDARYEEIVSQVLQAKSKTSNKQPAEYRLLKRFDLLCVQGVQKLISPVTASQGGETIRYFVKDSEIFDVLHESHLSIGHKGRDAMDNLIKQRYVNVTQADILMYLSFCRPCHEKKKTKRKGIVTNPILHDELNSRCQVDPWLISLTISQRQATTLNG